MARGGVGPPPLHPGGVQKNYATTITCRRMRSAKAESRMPCACPMSHLESAPVYTDDMF